MHIHIATAGKEINVIKYGLKLIPGIEKIYLIYSDAFQESADELKTTFDQMNIPSELRSVNAYDFQSVMDAIAGIKDEESLTGPHKYTINVTGGTKLMAFAAYSSAYFLGATVYYIQEGEDLPLEKRILPILTTRAPKSDKTNKKSREILRYIFECTSGNGTVTSQDIGKKFGLSKQQVSYYIKNLREDGLITADNGLYDPDTNVTNYRYNMLRLTQQGHMEARFTRNE